MKMMLCDTCQCRLYRASGDEIRDLYDGTRICPIVLVVIRKQHIFCSKECASKWLLDQPEKELRGGYPLW